MFGAFEHWRNIDDEQLRAVADKGGVVGVIFCPRFLGGDGLEPVVRHLSTSSTSAARTRPRSAATGTASSCPPPVCCDAAHLPLLTDALLRAGYGERVIGKVLRGNVMRVLQACPPVAALAQ